MPSPPSSLTRLLAVLCLSALSLCAADIPAKPDDIAGLRALTGEAMKQYSKGLSSAFDELFQAYFWDPKKAPELAEAFQQSIRGMRSDLAQAIGPPMPLEFEYLGSQRIGEHYVRFSYLQKHEWKAFPCSFAFSSATGKWRMVNITIGDPAGPLTERFIWAERAEELQAQPIRPRDLLKPTTLDDLRHSCDTFMAGMASGKIDGIYIRLLSEHFITPGSAIGVAERLEADLKLKRAQSLADLGSPLEGSAELLGISHCGPSMATLVYMLHYERGSDFISFPCYKARDSWALRIPLKNKVSSAESDLLFSFRPAEAAVPDSERPMFGITARTTTAMGKLSPSAMDELARDWWLETGKDTRLTSFIQAWKTQGVEMNRILGASIGKESTLIGSAAEGSRQLTIVQIFNREREPLLTSTTFLHREGKWRAAVWRVGDEAGLAAMPFMNYERANMAAKPPAKSPKPALPDTTELRKACDQFMTRMTTGQGNGAVKQILQKHKATDPDTEKEFLKDEAAFLSKKQILTAESGKPLPGNFELLGTARLQTAFASFYYVQHHEGDIGGWKFTFYRPKDEWRLGGIQFPGGGSLPMDHLGVIDRN